LMVCPSVDGLSITHRSVHHPSVYPSSVGLSITQRSVCHTKVCLSPAGLSITQRSVHHPKVHLSPEGRRPVGFGKFECLLCCSRHLQNMDPNKQVLPLVSPLLAFWGPRPLLPLGLPSSPWWFCKCCPFVALPPSLGTFLMPPLMQLGVFWPRCCRFLRPG
jgi:hypothetical protein